MTSQGRTPHISPVGRKPERNLQRRAVTVNSTRSNAVDFTAQFAQARPVEELSRDHLNLQRGNAVDNHVED